MELTRTVRYGDLQVNIVRTICNQPLEPVRDRLDVDTSPTPFVECLGNRVRNRILGTNIDVKTLLDCAKGANEDHILVILGIGDKTHKFVTSIFGGTQAVPTKVGRDMFETLKTSARSLHS